MEGRSPGMSSCGPNIEAQHELQTKHRRARTKFNDAQAPAGERHSRRRRRRRRGVQPSQLWHPGDIATLAPRRYHNFAMTPKIYRNFGTQDISKTCYVHTTSVGGTQLEPRRYQRLVVHTTSVGGRHAAISACGKWQALGGSGSLAYKEVLHRTPTPTRTRHDTLCMLQGCLPHLMKVLRSISLRDKGKGSLWACARRPCTMSVHGV